MGKKVKVLLLTVGSLLLTASIVLTTLFFVFDYKPKGKVVIDNWSNSQEYTEKYVSFVEKNPNKDFTILNLADIQLSDFEPAGTSKKMKKMIKELIDRTNPDLITLTGDNIWTNHSKNALAKEVKWFEEFKIPWAPVFGNHDGEGTASIEYQCDVFEKADYCLFKRGPSNIGSLGNYVVNIKENGVTKNSLYMLNLGYVDDFSKEQIEFVKWNAEGTKNTNNGTYVPSLAFFHQAIDAYNSAYYFHKNEALTDIYRSFYIADPGVGDDFFDLAKSINIKDIICGHQHGNAGTIPFEGVNLTFSLKTGDMCSIYEDKNNPNAFIVGATSLVLKESGTEYKLNFVDESYRIKTK